MSDDIRIPSHPEGPLASCREWPGRKWKLVTMVTTSNSTNWFYNSPVFQTYIVYCIKTERYTELKRWRRQPPTTRAILLSKLPRNALGCGNIEVDDKYIQRKLTSTSSLNHAIWWESIKLTEYVTPIQTESYKRYFYNVNFSHFTNK